MAFDQTTTLRDRISVMDEPNQELWKRHRRGDRQAYEELVESYLPLVKTTVGRMAMTIPSYISREELYSAGCVGLLSAVERYDPEREAKFTSYAITRIRGSILDELRHHDVLGRITRERVTRIHTAERELRNRDEDLSPESIAEEAGLSLDEYWDAEVGALATRRVSLNEMSDDAQGSLQDMLPAKRDADPGHALEMEEVVDLVEELFTEKEKMLVVLYYHEELTLKEIGVVMGVSESRVCQLHTAMVIRIRKELKKRGILV